MEHDKLPTLTSDETSKLEQDTTLVSTFKQEKFEKEAQKNWDKFYLRNTTKFFRDRHWTKREFEELCGFDEKTALISAWTLLEAGCGVGNLMFPLLEENLNQKLFCYACDFSPRAVDFVKTNPLYKDAQCKAFQCDLTRDELLDNVPGDCVDVATLIFVLSAIHPQKMEHVLLNIKKVLKPGGVLLFRDYGIYDHAMLRFAKGHKLQERFYVRQDGTRAYYFTTDEIQGFADSCGYSVISNEYIPRKTTNKKEGLSVDRVFVQAKLMKTKLGS